LSRRNGRIFRASLIDRNRKIEHHRSEKQIGREDIGISLLLDAALKGNVGYRGAFRDLHLQLRHIDAVHAAVTDGFSAMPTAIAAFNVFGASRSTGEAGARLAGSAPMMRR